MTANETISNIPDYFYPAFAGELVSVFGTDIFTQDDDGDNTLLYVSGTSGWHAALKMTCYKLNLYWLQNWYDELEWYDSDDFDSKLVELLFSKFLKAKSESANPYYLWLICDQGE